MEANVEDDDLGFKPGLLLPDLKLGPYFTSGLPPSAPGSRPLSSCLDYTDLELGLSFTSGLTPSSAPGPRTTVFLHSLF